MGTLSLLLYLLVKVVFAESLQILYVTKLAKCLGSQGVNDSINKSNIQ